MQKHRCLFADFSLEANARRDKKGAIGTFEAFGQLLPVTHVQYNAKMSCRNIIAINGVCVVAAIMVFNKVQA